MNNSHPRLWQRQPGETAADFTDFVAYLRLKHHRSLRAVANRTGRSLTAIRRLSARYNWPGRVHAFEERLAEATQTALDSVLHCTAAVEKSRLEKLRLDEFRLAQDVLQASERWLALATNPRRRSVHLPQILRLIELGSKLGRLAAGMPTGEQKAPKRAEPPGYWTQPSVAEALMRIYGPEPAVPLDTKPPVAPVQSPPPAPASPPPATPARTWPPPDDKRDLTPHALVIGDHGLLCLKRIDPPPS